MRSSCVGFQIFSIFLAVNGAVTNALTMDSIGEYGQHVSEDMANQSAVAQVIQDDTVRDLRPMFPHLTEGTIRETVVRQSKCIPDPTNLTRLMNSCIDQLLEPQSPSPSHEGVKLTGQMDFVDLTKEAQIVNEADKLGGDCSISCIDLIDSPELTLGMDAIFGTTDKVDVDLNFNNNGFLRKEGIETLGGSPKTPALIVNIASSSETESSSGEDKGSLSSDRLSSQWQDVPKEVLGDGAGITPLASSSGAPASQTSSGCRSGLHKTCESADDILMGSSGTGRKSHHTKSSKAPSTISRCPCSDCESTGSLASHSKHHSKSCQDTHKPFHLPSPTSAPSFVPASKSVHPDFLSTPSPGLRMKNTSTPESSPDACNSKKMLTSQDALLQDDELSDKLRASLKSVDAALQRLSQMCKTPRKSSISTKTGPSGPSFTGPPTASGVSPAPRTDAKENFRPAVPRDLAVTSKVGDLSGPRHSIHQPHRAAVPSGADSTSQFKYAASLSNQTCIERMYKKPSSTPNQPLSSSKATVHTTTTPSFQPEPGPQTLKTPPKSTVAVTNDRPIAQSQQKSSHNTIAPSVSTGVTGAKSQFLVGKTTSGNQRAGPPQVTRTISVKVDSNPATAAVTQPTGGLATKPASRPTVGSAGTTCTTLSTSTFRQQPPTVKHDGAPSKITPSSTFQQPNQVSKMPDRKYTCRGPMQDSLGQGSVQDPSDGHKKTPSSSMPKPQTQSGAVPALPSQNVSQSHNSPSTRPTIPLPEPANRPVLKQPSHARQPSVQFPNQSGFIPKAAHGHQPSFAVQFLRPGPVLHPVQKYLNQRTNVHQPPFQQPNPQPYPQQQLPAQPSVPNPPTVAHVQQPPVEHPNPPPYPQQQLPAQPSVLNPPTIAHVHQPPVEHPNPQPYPQQLPAQPSVPNPQTIVYVQQPPFEQPNPQPYPQQQLPAQPSVPNPPSIVRQPPVQRAHQGGIIPQAAWGRELPPASAVPQPQSQPATQPAPIQPAIVQQAPAQLPAQDNMHANGKSLPEMQTEVLMLFPEVDPGYVLTQLEAYKGHPSPVNEVCNHLLENPAYPRAQKQESLPTAVPKESQGEKFDFIQHYYKKPSSRVHAEDTIQQLQHDFKMIALDSLRTVLALHFYHYAPTRLCLEEIIRTNEDIRALLPRLKRSSYEQRKIRATITTKDKDGKDLQTKILIHMLKGRRHQYHTRKHAGLLEQIQLYEEYIKNSAVEKDRLFALSMNETEYEAEGQLIECGCCYGEVTFEKMVQCLDGHLFCESCLQMYAKQAVYGQGKAQLMCMTDGCDSSYPRDQLEKCLSAKDMSKYDERVQEESIQLADMDGLVRCPHCDFAAVLDPGDKVFSCQNTDCMKETCRHCREDWKDHFGKRCEEIEKKAETNIRTSYEERMSKAQIRTCHRCKTGIMKDQGCNKMTCRCGAKMCYICRKADIDYNHFCSHVRNPGQGCTTCTKCSLWTDPTEDDARAVKELELELKLEREKLAKDCAAQDSRDRLGPPDLLPEAKKQRVF